MTFRKSVYAHSKKELAQIIFQLKKAIEDGTNFIPNGSIMRFDYDNGSWKLVQMSIATNQFVDC